MTNHISSNDLTKKFSRRALFKDTGLALGTGSIIGTGAYFGLDYAQNKINNIVEGAEKQIRELALDVSELSGSLEGKLRTERKELEKHYTQGTLDIYEDLGIATPAEIKEIEQIIENYEAFEEHYNFVERAREFKDRIDRRLLTLDDSLESYQPEALRNINDSIRKFLGKPAGKEGISHRKQVKDRLEKLCTIYDTNSDNKRAQIEVVKTLNNYLDDATLTKEEKDLYGFLKEQHEKGCSKEDFRHFVDNYDNYSERQEVLLQLKSSLSEAEEIYGKIQENKAYVQTLQDLLYQGIALKQEVRQRSTQEVSQYKKQIDTQIGEFRDSVDGVIKELKQKGYAIETRQDYIDKGYFAQSIGAFLKPFVIGGTLIAGSLAAIAAFRGRAKTRKVRSTQQALESAVEAHNEISEKYDIVHRNYELLKKANSLLSQKYETEKNKNHDLPDYTEGSDIY